jgi:hypothetical protein
VLNYPISNYLPGDWQKMDLMQYWKENGKAGAEAMCQAVGTSYEYFKHICNKRKRPSVDLARKMVAFSGDKLSLNELLFPIDQKRK